MHPLSKRLIVSFSLLAFIICFVTGMIYEVKADQIFLRSIVAFFIFGIVTACIALIFEKLWNK